MVASKYERPFRVLRTECATVQGACRLLGLSWDQVWGICERAVKRGQARKKARIVTHYGVDEKAFKRATAT